jgi:hypothetical protein
MMKSILQFLRDKPEAVALLTLLMVSFSPTRKDQNMTRGLLYLFAFLMSAYILVSGFVGKAGSGVALGMVVILGYQLRLIGIMRGDKAEHDLSIFRNIQRRFPNAPAWLNVFVPALLIGVIALLSLKIIYAILNL